MNRVATTSVFVALLACGSNTPQTQDPAAAASAPSTANSERAAASGGGAVQAATSNGVRSEREAMLEARVEALEDRMMAAEEKLRGQAPRRPTPPRGPDPASVYSVDIQGNAFRGAADAKVTIVKSFEFACPFCEKSRTTIDSLLTTYKGDIKVVYKSFVVHRQVATPAALASCAAGRQGKFEKMAEAIWTYGYGPYRLSRDVSKLAAPNMRKLAKKRARLKMKKYDADLLDCQKQIAKDESDLRKVGVTGTPAFFINGRFLRGAQPVAKFQTLIDEELSKANQRIKAGSATVSDYYDKFVFGAGKKSL